MLISLTSENTEMLITSDISLLFLFIPQLDEIQEMVSHRAQILSVAGHRHHPAGRPGSHSFGC